MSPEVLVILIQLTDPGHNRVDMNPADIVSLRDVSNGELLAEGAKCMVNTLDGRYIAVLETCEAIRRLMLEAH